MRLPKDALVQPMHGAPERVQVLVAEFHCRNVQSASVLMLEPVDEVTVLVADEYVGGVMSDLSGRRGRVGGTEPIGAGRTLIRAEVPQLEITRYAIDLRSISHGTATFTRAYARHEAMPPQLAQKMQAE